MPDRGIHAPIPVARHATAQELVRAVIAATAMLPQATATAPTTTTVFTAPA